MVHQFAYSTLFGFPVIMYFGIVTYLLLLSTATVALLNVKYGIRKIPFKYHPPLAAATIIVGTLHAILGLSLYLNF